MPNNKTELEQTIKRLIEENGSINSQLMNIHFEINKSSFSGLSTIQAIKQMSNKCIEQENQIRELKQQIVLLKQKLEYSHKQLIEDIINKLNNI